MHPLRWYVPSREPTAIARDRATRYRATLFLRDSIPERSRSIPIPSQVSSNTPSKCVSANFRAAADASNSVPPALRDDDHGSSLGGYLPAIHASRPARTRVDNAAARPARRIRDDSAPASSAPTLLVLSSRLRSSSFHTSSTAEHVSGASVAIFAGGDALVASDGSSRHADLSPARARAIGASGPRGGLERGVELGECIGDGVEKRVARGG